MDPEKNNYKDTRNPRPPAATKVLVWFVDGPLAGENIEVTRGIPNWLHHIRDAGVSVSYKVDWGKPTPMAFYEGGTMGEWFG